MKILSGSELADFIKVRQAQQVRGLRQAFATIPRLAIIKVIDDPVINMYVKLKQAYGSDIEVEVDVHSNAQGSVKKLIAKLNNDPLIHGIIVQLPLEDTTQTSDILNSVIPAKDVDALGEKAVLDPATPTAINWLLAGYNIDLMSKKIVIVGKGRLVGAPLAKMWQASGYDVRILGKDDNLASELKTADIIVSATGSPGSITSNMIPIGSVVVDAGVASENGKTIGDIAPDVYKRSDLTITPQKGGVGPLTVAALFENVISSARP